MLYKIKWFQFDCTFHGRSKWPSEQEAWAAVLSTNQAKSVAEFKALGINVVAAHASVYDYAVDLLNGDTDKAVRNGIAILNEWRVSQTMIDAYCLQYILSLVSAKELRTLWPAAYTLACECHARASDYLCVPGNDYVTTVDKVAELVGQMSEECRKILLACKIRGYTDFEIYSFEKDVRANETRRHFHLWLNYLHDVAPV